MATKLQSVTGADPQANLSLPGWLYHDAGFFAAVKPVALEEWRGFLFVRLEEGLPSVAEMMAPYEAEVALYRFEDLRAIGRVTLRPRRLNWQTIADGKPISGSGRGTTVLKRAGDRWWIVHEHLSGWPD